jgi:2-C-methyl-D-erythritol 4-phosphate cytidylyltransferase
MSTGEQRHNGTLGVVIVAAGSGTRFGDRAKVFAPLAGRPLVTHSLVVFAAYPGVRRTVLVLGAHTLGRGRELLVELGLRDARTVLGGETRSESVRAGIAALGDDIDLVAVHDAARPLVRADLIARVVAGAAMTGAAVPVVPVSDTIHHDASGRIGATLDRTPLRAAQTPQVARRTWLLQALADARASTDEGGMLHAAGFPVALVAGDPANIKITRPDDLAIAEAILASRRTLV